MNSSHQATYFEYIGLLSFFNCLIRNSLKKEDALYFYVDASKGFTLWMPVFKVLGFNIKNLSFHLKDIKAKNGELVQERIRREDLFQFEQKIIDEHSSFFKKESDSHPRLKSFILRSLIDESQMERRKKSSSFLKGKDYDHHTKSFVSSSKNRGGMGKTGGTKNE